MVRIVALLTLALFVAAAQAQAIDGRLKKIAAAKAISIAYRADAVPFSFVNDKGQPDGYAIDLCKRVVSSIERQLNVAGLKVNWVPVTVQTRFEAVAKGRADMECGSSTMTLGRMKEVDFSSVTFVETTGLLARTKAARARFPTCRERRSRWSRAPPTSAPSMSSSSAGNERDRVAVDSRDEAIAALEGGKADAFASDRLLLVGAGSKAKDPRALTLLPDQLSFEPYGIVVPRGDAGMRLAVNTGLAQVYGGDEIVEIFRRWFGALGRPSAVLESAYILGSIPE